MPARRAVPAARSANVKVASPSCSARCSMRGIDVLDYLDDHRSGGVTRHGIAAKCPAVTGEALDRELARRVDRHADRAVAIGAGDVGARRAPALDLRSESSMRRHMGGCELQL